MSNTQLHQLKTHHATTVCIDGRGVMIEGASGAGKSALALQLMAYGAGLIADDVTALSLREGVLWAAAPETLPAAIEARGIGLLPVDLAPSAPLTLIIDMQTVENTRLPEPLFRVVLGQKVALLNKIEAAHFPAAILQYVKSQGAQMR